MAAAKDRDEQAVEQFVEKFALSLTIAGLPRMPARVFSALLARDDGAMDAGQIAEALQVSPAAVSGAVRYLVQVGMVSREREVGAKRDHYILQGDFWYEAVAHRDAELDRWSEQSRQGAEAVGPDTPAGRRLTETAAFFQFVKAEMPAMMRRWHRRRASLTPPEAPASGTRKRPAPQEPRRAAR